MEDTSCFTIAREIPHMSWGLRRQRTAATANVPSVVGCALADPGLNERDLCLGQLSPGLGHDAPGAHVHTCQLVDQIAGLRRGGSDVLAAAARRGDVDQVGVGDAGGEAQPCRRAIAAVAGAGAAATEDWLYLPGEADAGAAADTGAALTALAAGAGMAAAAAALAVRACV